MIGSWAVGAGQVYQVISIFEFPMTVWDRSKDPQGFFPKADILPDSQLIAPERMAFPRGK